MTLEGKGGKDYIIPGGHVVRVVGEECGAPSQSQKLTQLLHTHVPKLSLKLPPPPQTKVSITSTFQKPSVRGNGCDFPSLSTTLKTNSGVCDSSSQYFNWRKQLREPHGWTFFPTPHSHWEQKWLTGVSSSAMCWDEDFVDTHRMWGFEEYLPQQCHFLASSHFCFSLLMLNPFHE